MSRSSHLFAGIFGAFAASCVALVFVPQLQIGGLGAQVTEEEGEVVDVYPVVNTRQGREVYIREGCYYCHSQQLRDPQNGTDIGRGWGPRRTVARDYIYDSPPLLGNARIGPDLSNVGSETWRNEPEGDPRKAAKRDAQWHYTHLYNPRSIVTESNMPPYRYLFEKRKIGGQRSGDAVDVPVEAGYEIVPTAEARQLVAYLRSLDRTHALDEAKVAAPAKDKAETKPAEGAAPAAK